MCDSTTDDYYQHDCHPGSTKPPDNIIVFGIIQNFIAVHQFYGTHWSFINPSPAEPRYVLPLQTV